MPTLTIAAPLLDPKNDLVFKKLFANAPVLLPAQAWCVPEANGFAFFFPAAKQLKI